eukprot:TRINITY_DN1103_c0_g1_i1.p1 TRINITY_DN1103_c0_g1~~TRINITY_DN1103_c0_g1_i1.p1  ORF type:complete len:175 (-),score=29.72 TRINITY_DN1103_c0_g1_i1:10-534(-)
MDCSILFVSARRRRQRPAAAAANASRHCCWYRGCSYCSAVGSPGTTLAAVAAGASAGLLASARGRGGGAEEEAPVEARGPLLEESVDNEAGEASEEQLQPLTLDFVAGGREALVLLDVLLLMALTVAGFRLCCPQRVRTTALHRSCGCRRACFGRCRCFVSRGRRGRQRLSAGA